MARFLTTVLVLIVQSNIAAGTFNDNSPIFSPREYAFLVNHNDAIGTVVGTITATDADVGSFGVITYTLDQTSLAKQYFTISNAGVISILNPIDGSPLGYTTTVTILATATDTGGRNDTAIVVIGITADDINYYAPVFSPDVYSFNVDYYATVGTSVGTVTATDADIGSHGLFTYSLDQSTLPNPYFSISSSGEITLASSLIDSPMGGATTVTILSNAEDTGALTDTAIVVIGISEMTTTTSTTTTTVTYKSFLDNTGNVTWMAFCIVLFIGSLLLLAYIVFTCYGDNGCDAFLRTCRGQYRKSVEWKPSRYDSAPYDVEDDPFTRTVRPPPPARDHIWQTGYN